MPFYCFSYRLGTQVELDLHERALDGPAWPSLAYPLLAKDGAVYIHMSCAGLAQMTCKGYGGVCMRDISLSDVWLRFMDWRGTNWRGIG